MMLRSLFLSPLLLVSLLLLALELSTTTITTTTVQGLAQVQVFDNVITASTCRSLYELAGNHADRCHENGSSYFDRRASARTKPLTPLEQALESILQKIDERNGSTLNDDDDDGDERNNIVEYWHRDEHIHMDMHVDIDEDALEENDVIRCPEWGHVLYLHVANGLNGPTCILPTDCLNDEADSLVTVPSVAGRLLRFPGSSLHGVPKPHNRWLLPSDEQERLRQEERDEELQYEETDDDDEEEEEMWDEYDDEDDNDRDDESDEESNDILSAERAVILFNTWSSKDGPPPLGVTPDPIVAIQTMPDGIELAFADDDEEEEENEDDTGIDGGDSFVEEQIADQYARWKDQYGPELICNDLNEWKEIPVQSFPNKDAAEDCIDVRLMGNKRRRLQRDAVLSLPVCHQDLRTALDDTTAPSKFPFMPRVDNT